MDDIRTSSDSQLPDGVVFQRYYLGCLSHASYLLGDAVTGRAVVVDPRRDVDGYIADAEAAGLKIVGVIETHLHADFVSGHRELARRTGADIYIGRIDAGFEYHAADDGGTLELGPSVRLRFLETPGHTLEGITILAYLPAGAAEPALAFTGDTLFIGDVGRPDLAQAVISSEELARMMHRSLAEKILTLPDSTKVYPAHGAGSACGKALRDADVSTIGTERATNPALTHIEDPEQFVADLIAGLPPAPPYFSKDAQMNRAGAGSLEDLLATAPELTPVEVEEMQEEGALLLDTRPVEAFCHEHIAGAIHVDLEGRFAPWVGTIVPGDAVVIVVADPGHREEAITRLARVGYERVAGTFTQPLSVWRQAGGRLASVPTVSAKEVAWDLMRGGTPKIVDVRTGAEFAEARIPGSRNVPLHELPGRLGEFLPEEEVTVTCGSGYRSSIACSLLLRAGVRNVKNLTGGWESWLAAGAPVEQVG